MPVYSYICKSCKNIQDEIHGIGESAMNVDQPILNNTSGFIKSQFMGSQRLRIREEEKRD